METYKTKPKYELLALDVRPEWMPPRWASMPGMPVAQKKTESLETKVE